MNLCMYIRMYYTHVCACNTLPSPRPFPPPPPLSLGIFRDVSRMHPTKQTAAEHNFCLRTSFYTLMVFVGVFAVCFFSVRGEISRFLHAEVRLKVVGDAQGLSRTL